MAARPGGTRLFLGFGFFGGRFGRFIGIAVDGDVVIVLVVSFFIIIISAVVPIACSYPFFQKYFISGLTIGAVKG